MSKTIFIYVPGIRTDPGAAYNWCGRAVTWTHVHRDPYKAEKVEYYTPALLRPFGQNERAHKLQRVILFYSGSQHNIHLVGHSNGCDVILDALRSLHADGGEFIRFKSLHLVSGACDRDFKSNGLNLWLEKIDRTVVYIAKRDLALRAADTVIGRMLGYGTLGRHGAANVKPGETVEHVYRTFGHSDWWAPERFDATMCSFTDSR